MAGGGEHLDLAPEHADPARQDAQVGGLDDDGRVPHDACADRRQGAVPAALLLDRTNKGDRRRPGVGIDRQERLEGERGHRQASLHVARTAPCHPPVAHVRDERRGRPQALVSGGDDVQVAVQEQGSGTGRAEPAHDDAAVGVLRGAASGHGIAVDPVRVRHPLDRKADPCELLRQHAFCSRLVAGQAALAHEGVQERARPVAEMLDGRIDALQP